MPRFRSGFPAIPLTVTPGPSPSTANISSRGRSGKQLEEPFTPVGDGGEVQELPPLVGEGEGHVGAGQGVVFEEADDVGQLRGRGPEELPAGGDVEEQIPHLDARPGEEAAGLEATEASPLDRHGPPLLGILGPAGEGEAAHGGDGREGLAAEPEGGDGEEVLLGAELARGVALQGHEEVVPPHAAAVVLHEDAPLSPGNKLHRDSGGSRVQGVLHQLFHHRGGPLDDLARGDLVDQVVGQHSDPVHRSPRGDKDSRGRET